jgi:CHAT domain-containing protein
MCREVAVGRVIVGPILKLASLNAALAAIAAAAAIHLAVPPAHAQQQPQQQHRKQAREEAVDLEKQADAEIEQGHFAAAEPLIEHALQLRETTLGPDAAPVAQSLNQLGRVYRAETRFGEARTALERALAIREKAFGPDHPSVGQTLNQLAALDGSEGRYAEAEPLRERALVIAEKAWGPDDSRVGVNLANLAELYRLEGRYKEAEPLVARAIAIQEKSTDPFRDAESLHIMAMLYQAQGRFGEAKSLVERAVATLDKERPDTLALAVALNSLAQLDVARGHFADAEPAYKRALAIREKVLGDDHPVVAQSVDDLGALYRIEGHWADAEALAKRALAIREKALGPDHIVVAVSLNNLAVLYTAEARFADAEALYQRALAIREKVLGPDHRLVATTLVNLAQLYKMQNKMQNTPPEKSEPLLQRALAIQEKALGPDHPEIARTLDLLGGLERDRGHATAAEPLLKRALAIQEAALGPDHPGLAQTFDDLALVYQAEHEADLALRQSSRAIDILTRHFDTESSQKVTTDSDEERHHRSAFVLHILLADQAAQPPDQRDAMVKETFRTAQLTQYSAAASALAGMAARFGDGDDALARLVRDRRGVVEQWQRLDTAIVEALSRSAGARNPASEAAMRVDLDAAAKRLQALDQQILHDFPAYAELSSPQPVSLEVTQSFLAADEALLVYVVGTKQSWLWVVRRDGGQLYDIALGAQGLAIAVQGLRASLDPAINPNLRPYPAGKAYALYQRILAPALPMLQGVHHVIIVPDAALESLPLGVLVTKFPARDPSEFADHRQIAWLARDYAVTVLPAVSSLRALRQVAMKSKAASPFLGIGDPALQGKEGGTRGVATMADLFKGDLADIDKVRRLPRLPETADELRSIAASLGAPETALYLGDRASEPLLRKADLESYRVIEFATHGLMSGELTGLAEPALVLTPPTVATSDNDGLLTASKIARLKLDADWVVLSACNTAAGDGTPGADGLSGLAKAFFYAGSRSILVSNWSIASKASVKLTTGIFAALVQDPSIGRAEALRRAELALLDDQSLPAAYAHPMIWAPFTLAGEGGAGR